MSWFGLMSCMYGADSVLLVIKMTGADIMYVYSTYRPMSLSFSFSLCLDCTLRVTIQVSRQLKRFGVEKVELSQAAWYLASL